MRTAKESVLVETCPLAGNLREFQPITISLVNKTDLEPVWDHMVRTHHYLGYHQMIGPRIKYLACYGNVPIAALSYNRAALRVGARDKYLGWDEELKTEILALRGQQQPVFDPTVGEHPLSGLAPAVAYV